MTVYCQLTDDHLWESTVSHTLWMSMFYTTVYQSHKLKKKHLWHYSKFMSVYLPHLSYLPYDIWYIYRWALLVASYSIWWRYISSLSYWHILLYMMLQYMYTWCLLTIPYSIQSCSVCDLYWQYLTLYNANIYIYTLLILTISYSIFSTDNLNVT